MKSLTFLAALMAALQLSSSPAVASGDWTWPVRGQVITPYRNGSDPYAAGQHRGIDIAGAAGDPVVAATAGTVTFAGVAGSSGLTVSIRTADRRFDTSYLHLSSGAVRAGQPVSAGQRIGAVGTTGRRSTDRPHLHFGVREAGKRQAYRDPLDFLAPPPAAPRPEPAPPRGAPVPVGDRAPIALPAAVSPAAAPVAAPAAPPRGLASALPAPRSPSVPAHAVRAGRSPHAGARGRPLPAVTSAVARPRLPLNAGPRVQAAHRASRPAQGGRADAPHVRLDGAPRDDAASAPGTARPVTRPASGSVPSRRGGFDAGWLAACVGLVAAACALGRPEGARAAVARGRDAFVSLLRPLGGRG